MYRHPAILSIGENPDSSRLLKKILSRSGYDVRSADSIHTALAAATARAPDLIVADLNMPRAMELCRLIKARDGSRDVPVIVLTGSDNVMDGLEALRAGASDFVATPFRPEELRIRVNTHLELSRLGLTVQELCRRDIAKPGKTESALRESESRFCDMANTAPVMIVASGPDGRTTFFNTAWLEFRGRSIDQELGWGWMEGLHPDDRDALLANYARTFEARRNCQLEYRLRRADGEYRWILCNGVPRYGAGSVFIGYLASCVDVTNIRRSEEQRLKLEQAERLTLFAAGVAHDFNNLLGAAFAELDMVLPVFPSGAPARQHLQSIESILARASEIVDLLISYSTTGSTPALEAVDISALVEDIIHLMGGVLSRKAVRVTCKPCADLPPILANGPQIRRVVMNLINNAVEALGSKERLITVSTSFMHIDGDHKPMKPAGLKDGDYVSLLVTDTGRGMTEETLSRALHPFFTTKSRGHGLGLAVVESIVRSHGGVIRVSSTAGRGTTFEVLLPCAPGADGGRREASHQAASTGLPPRRHMSVLIVEDEPMLRSATGAWLEDRGFRLVYACDGEEALQRIVDSTLDIDAVILDLTLPDISGAEVLAKIEEIRPGAAIVLTSGHDAEAHNLEDIAVDRNRVFLRKPYRLSDLVQTLLNTPAVVLNPRFRVADRNGLSNL